MKHKSLSDITDKLLQAPQTLSVGTVRSPHEDIHHQAILADSQQHKDKLLLALAQKGGFQRALVFAAKRSSADRLAGLLGHHDHKVGSLHGELRTEERKRIVSQFAEGKVRIVCASDLAARGLDIADIDLVINYDLPRNGDDYLHRTGRIGRAGKKGLAISLITADQWNLGVSIQRYLNLEFERRSLAGLKAKYSGPKKTKSSGKAAGKKRKKNPQEKAKSRSRNQKAVGKPQGKSTRAKPLGDGFAPLTRKKK